MEAQCKGSDPRTRAIMGCVTVLFWVIATVYDLATLPLYMIIQRPWVRRRAQQTVWAAQLSNEPGASFTRLTPDTARPRFKGCDTVDSLFRLAVKLHSDRPCLGTRLVKGHKREVLDGKTIVKYDLGEYQWTTYKEVETKVDEIGRGLAGVGIGPETRVIVFAETREEWMLTALACFRRRVIVCTVYATLGDEGIVFCVNETESRVMITSAELLPKLQILMPRLPHLRRIIYMPARGASTIVPNMAPASIVPFASLLGSPAAAAGTPPVTPTAEDAIIIMYTSGSTGQPKGVIITNGNLVAFVLGIASVLQKFEEQDVHIGFLPLAHVMEIAAECCFMTLGLRIGYSSPFTLTAQGTALMPGTPGDAVVLKPTMMIAVPLLLNRIRKAVEQQISSRGACTRGLFAFALSYKSFWRRQGFSTPLLNRIVFRKTKNCLGGRLKVIVNGSAPLSVETQEYLTNCLDCPIIQGYGLTETTAGATLQDPDDDIVCGVAGPPLNGVFIRLVDWTEGGYRITDKPFPRGEIVIGGPTVAAGYFKRPELTKECFEEGPIRWFYTGDIGEFIPQGLLRIIDRKKDLVKLQYGEYVSLGKVETALKTHPLVDNVCVVGSSLSTFTVALVQPNQPALRKLAPLVGIPDAVSMAALCDDGRLNKMVAEQLVAHCVKAGLVKFEIPLKYKLCKETWTPESELVTAALKIRRVQLRAFYERDISEMYRESSTSADPR